MSEQESSRQAVIRRRGYLKEDYHYFYLKDCEGQELDFHFHDFHKLVILLSGQATYEMEGMSFTLPPWTPLLVPQRTIHRVQIDRHQPYERVILYLRPGAFRDLGLPEEILDLFNSAHRTGAFLLQAQPEELEQLKRIYTSFESSYQDDRFGAKIICDTLIIQMLVILTRMNRILPESEKSTYDKRIAKITSHIQNHLRDPLSVKDLAELVHVSPSYLMHYFRKEMGCPVSAYVRQRRLLAASRMIREGTPARQAAEACGFPEYSTFYRSFRTAFGVSPSKLE